MLKFNLNFNTFTVQMIQTLLTSSKHYNISRNTKQYHFIFYEYFRNRKLKQKLTITRMSRINKISVCPNTIKSHIKAQHTR